MSRSVFRPPRPWPQAASWSASTDLGGAEFFSTRTTGVPVEEGDVAALVVAVEQVIEEYAREPARLDAIRRHASEVVNARYSVEAF